MKHLFTAARILLGVIFLVFSLNYWLQFLPIPGQPEGSHGANFMGAIFATKFLTVVKVLELVAAVLLISGRYINLALFLLGPIIINIRFFVKKRGVEVDQEGRRDGWKTKSFSIVPFSWRRRGLCVA
jgi:putative oxidoreductase